MPLDPLVEPANRGERAHFEAPEAPCDCDAWTFRPASIVLNGLPGHAIAG